MVTTKILHGDHEKFSPYIRYYIRLIEELIGKTIFFEKIKTKSKPTMEQQFRPRWNPELSSPELFVLDEKVAELGLSPWYANGKACQTYRNSVTSVSYFSTIMVGMTSCTPWRIEVILAGTVL